MKTSQMKRADNFELMLCRSALLLHAHLRKSTKFLLGSLLLSMHLGCVTSSAPVPLKMMETLDQLAANDRRDIRELIESDESLRHLDLLEASYDVETQESLGLPAVKLTFASTECESRVRRRTVAIRNRVGWQTSSIDRVLGEVTLRGPISCSEADQALATFAAQRGSVPELWAGSPNPDEVGKAYSFLPANQLGGKDEELLAVAQWEGSRQWVVLIRGSTIVGVRSRTVITKAPPPRTLPTPARTVPHHRKAA